MSETALDSRNKFNSPSSNKAFNQYTRTSNSDQSRHHSVVPKPTEKTSSNHCPFSSTDTRIVISPLPPYDITPVTPQTLPRTSLLPIRRSSSPKPMASSKPGTSHRRYVYPRNAVRLRTSMACHASCGSRRILSRGLLRSRGFFFFGDLVAA